MYGKLKKNIGFSLIIFAFFFLFEPTYALYDPLPDAVGYVILLMGLINLADISTRISEAFCGFRRALVLSIVRYISIYLLNTYFVKEEQTLGLLIIVFLLAIFEIIILIPAYKSLFSGLLTLGMFYESEAVYLQKKPGSANATEKLYRFTVVFILAKSILCALPDFTTLQTNSSYEFITILRSLMCLILLPISLVWLVKSVRYFNRLKKEERFINAISQEYLKKCEGAPEFYTYRILKVGLYMMIAAFVLSFDIYSESINILPDFLFFAILMLSLIFLRNHSNKKVSAIVISIVGAVTSVGLFLCEKSFFTDYPYITAVKKNADAYYRYYILLALYIVLAFITVLVAAWVVRFLHELFCEHTYLKYGSQEDEKRSLIKGFRLRAYASLVSCILSAIGSVYYIWSLPFKNKGWFFYYSGIFSFLFSVAFIVSIYTLISYVLNEIKQNYRNKL